MQKIGPKEQAAKDRRNDISVPKDGSLPKFLDRKVNGVKPVAKPAPVPLKSVAISQPKVEDVSAKPQESTMSAAAKKIATATKTAPASKASAKTNARTPVKKSKSDLVQDMLLEGATREELHKVTGWPGGANLGVAAKRAKKKLVEKAGRFFLV
jgi:hypothetical protein